ncbi:MAG: TolC family protein [Prolixibacteraceae bacterium]|nr:TolC family protein [Prolixibacteraceae bacterium]
MKLTCYNDDLQCGNTKSVERDVYSFCLLQLRSAKTYLFTFYLLNFVRVKSRKRNLLFLIVILLSLQISAQEKWTLNECIGYAIKNNLQLQDAQLNEKIAGLNYRQSKWNLLPGVGAGVDAGLNYGRSVDPNTNGIVNTSFFNNSYYLGTSLDLFRGFMLQNQIRYQKFRKESAENNRLNATDDLAFAVMNAFFNVVYYEELLKIANEQKALSEMNVRKTQILVATGLKAQTDLLEVNANFEKEELFCIQTSNNIASSWISLKKAMNLPPDKQITLDIPKENPVVAEVVADIPALFGQHISWSPYIRSFESEFQASQKSLNMSKAGFFPSIKLQAAYNTGFYETNKDADEQIIAFNSQIKNNRSQFVGASMSIPIFSKNSVRFDVKRSRLASEQSQTKLDLAKQTVQYEMEENYNQLTASWKELRQAGKQLEADTLAFQAAQKKFDQGMINAVDLYTIKNRLANTTSQVLRSKLTYEMKKRILDFYKGERFWE